MIEIIPNWHPIFVHFTIGLFSTSVGFYVLTFISSFIKSPRKIYAAEFEIVARWCLWVVAFITIGTVLAGLYAYNTVNHDEASHIAMTNHRNWALATASGIWLLAGWSVWRYYKRRVLTITFVISLLIVQGLLFSTAWRGGECVYRYGLGVMSLPKAEGTGHQHHHQETTSSASSSPQETNDSQTQDENSDNHQHENTQ